MTDYLREMGIKVNYLHSDVDTLERVEILRDLRLGVYDVLVGINLLREGLDLPEVALIAILDADKESYMRDARSLIQTIGRAARNVEGHVILYADGISGSMQRAMDETERRRNIQIAYNEEHGITPATIIKAVYNLERQQSRAIEDTIATLASGLPPDEIERLIKDLERQMKKATCSSNAPPSYATGWWRCAAMPWNIETRCRRRPPPSRASGTSPRPVA